VPTVPICDIEGGEHTLLKPDLVPSLKSVDILVETDEKLSPGVRDALEDRFRGTHVLQFRSARPTGFDMPTSIELASAIALQAMEDHRYADIEWAWMVARGRSMSA